MSSSKKGLFLAIGRAIVDQICPLTHAKQLELGFTPGTRSLISSKDLTALSQRLSLGNDSAFPGGSESNTAATYSQLKGSARLVFPEELKLARAANRLADENILA